MEQVRDIDRPVTVELYVTEREVRRLLGDDEGSTVREFLSRVSRVLGPAVGAACVNQNVGLVLVEHPPPRARRYRLLD